MKPRRQSATRDQRRGHHGPNLQRGIDAVATMDSICNAGSMPWPPRRRNGYRFRCRDHHGVELDTTFDAVATMATNWIPLLMPWPPWRRIGYHFRCRGRPASTKAPPHDNPRAFHENQTILLPIAPHSFRAKSPASSSPCRISTQMNRLPRDITTPTPLSNMFGLLPPRLCHHDMTFD